MKNVQILLLLFLFVACNSPSAQETAAAKKPAVTQKTTQAQKPKVTQKTAAVQVKTTESKINWLSLEEAQEQNKKNPKKLLVDMYTHWCGPCKMMDRSTFADDEVAKHINENYYAVKFNAESPDPVNFKGKAFANPNYNSQKGANRRNSAHQFTQSLGLRGYPTLVIFDQNLSVINKIVGFKRAPQLLQTLASIK